jgi:U3 small nucleolar RNA-associated protein 4
LKQKRNQASDERVHRLIARIAVKGDEAIASASVSKDGQVLAIITASETRIFRLLPPEDETVEALRIEKVEVETPLPGGRDVQISPNQKWLSIVSNTNDVLVYRLSEAEGSLHISRRGFRVERVKRGSDSSSLQSYRRVITRQQFSADSKILVVTDISGFLDCWSLEGEEDRSAPDVEMQDADDDTSDTSSSSEEDEGNAEFKSYGQYWSSMESSKTLPQLDSAALVLSFRPAAKVKRIQTNGANGTHLNGVVKKSLSGEAGRDEHEAEEDDDVTEQPNNKYELFILSANHRLYELDLSAGRLTDWSRRNATNCLPVTLNKIKDRAMGCYWHTSPEAQRLYLYGSNWLFMLDVLQNFEPETDPDELEKENGLIGRPQKRKWQGESGAGDKIREEDYAGFKPGMQTTQNREPVKKKKKEQQNLVKTEGGEDEDEEEDVLPNKRLQPADSPMNDVRKESDADDDEKEEAGESRHPRKTWHSFAYRPIFAVIPLKETSSYIETVLVERPMWELNLPPRLAGPHDR